MLRTKGYRRIADDLRHDQHMKVNDKRIRRICQKKSIKSTIKYANNGCMRHARDAQFLAENILTAPFIIQQVQLHILLPPDAVLRSYSPLCTSQVVRDTSS